ncbi:MAG: hypothetical protein K6G88_07000 [Lachnospiraceae bacterium]|nr:hypothetical protein [Lachnospiraceae bacterium]
MATRPVFLVNSCFPYYSEVDVDFVYNQGFAPCQKKKNIIAIHGAFHKDHKDVNVLEISSKSFDETGVNLSAFNLQLYVKSLEKHMPVEVMYHVGKVFEKSGQHREMLDMTPRECKKYLFNNSFGKVDYFLFESQRVNTENFCDFYNWLYIRALLENETLSRGLLEYQAFTDVEYNPNRSKNCQARSAAIFVSLFKLGKVYYGEELTFDRYKEITDKLNYVVWDA